MPFVERVFDYQSVAFVGMDKNSGKTEVLNYFLKMAAKYSQKIAITSIGIDGESTDQVTKTSKPELFLNKGSLFITSEYFYNKRKLISKVVDVSNESTPLGRLVTAEVLEQGRVILAGPCSTISLKRHIDRLICCGAELVLVDGALSRLSLASPAITQAMILCTGAVLSHNIDEIVRKTAYTVSLISTEEFNTNRKSEINAIERGVYAINDDKEIDLEIDSIFFIDGAKNRLFEHGYTIFFTGVVNDSLFDFISKQKFASEVKIVVRDFTKIFASKKSYDIFKSRGAKLYVLNSSELLAVCVNPVSPKGYVLDSDEICDKLKKKINVLVCDVKKQTVF